MMLNFGLATIYQSTYVQMSAFRFPLSIIISRVQHLWFAIELLNRHFQTKAGIKIGLYSFVA